MQVNRINLGNPKECTKYVRFHNKVKLHMFNLELFLCVHASGSAVVCLCIADLLANIAV